MVYVFGQNVRYKIYMLYYICGKYVYYCMFVYGNYRAGRLFLKSLLFQDQNFVQDKGQKSSEGIILFTFSLPYGERKNCPQNFTPDQDLNLDHNVNFADNFCLTFKQFYHSLKSQFEIFGGILLLNGS